MCSLDHTFSPLVISAEDTLRMSMKDYAYRFDDVSLQITSYGDFMHALQRGEDMIMLGMVLNGLLVLEKVVFNPFSQTIAVVRDSVIDPILSSALRPYVAIQR